MTLKKIPKTIEIVFTNTDGLKLLSENSYQYIYKILTKNFEKVLITNIKNEEDLKNLVLRSPDLVFSGVKFLKFLKFPKLNKIIWLSDYLEKAGIKYTGSNKKALEYELDKSKSKQKIQKADLNTSPYFTALPSEYKKSSNLPLDFPLFIKPLCQGGGKGIGFDSIVHNFKSFENKIKDIFNQTKKPALVEKFLAGREFTVSIIESKDQIKILPIEIICKPNKDNEKVCSEKIKKLDAEKLTFIYDRKIFNQVTELAIESFKALGAYGHGRIDIRMDEKNEKAYFLEANLVPGLNKNNSYLPRSCKINQDMNFEELILKIVESGLARKFHS